MTATVTVPTYIYNTGVLSPSTAVPTPNAPPAVYNTVATSYGETVREPSSQIMQADVSYLHGTSFFDLLGTLLFWLAEVVGTLVICALLACAVVEAAGWLRDLHRVVSRERGTRS